MTLHRSALFLATVSVLAACATTAPHTASAPQPAACSDSLYVRLNHQQPDSLSERSWQRLQSLDSACVRARAHADYEARGTGMGGMMGMGHGDGRVWTILMPLVIAGMVVAMLALRL